MNKKNINRHLADSSLSDHTLDQELQDEVMEIWEAMHFDFDIVDEPSGLKEEVLNFVFDQERREEDPIKQKKSYFKSIWKQFTPLTASLCTALLLCIIVLVSPLFKQGPGVNEISASMMLTAATEEVGDAYGYAFLVNKNDKEELIINVYGFPETQEMEVYQVWTINNGRRQSAGIFKTDKDGFGVLTVDTSKLDAFDTIGITLEPDSTSKQPRGKKIVGTG